MRLEVSINGKKKCVAGIESFGVLTAIITRLKLRPERFDEERHADITKEEFLREKVNIEIGGVDSNEDKGVHGQHFNYLQDELKEGDEVVIRILPSGPYDEPTVKTPYK